MKRTYIILALIFLFMAVGLVFLPQQENSKETKPSQIFSSLNLPYRYISTDNVAARIIKKDPALCLVDVREAAEFNDFSLQGAVNIPLSKFMDEEYQSILKQKGMDYIFYSNGDLNAENAWLIGSRLGYKNLYIMKGGLNTWVETIFNPQQPLPSAPSEAWAKYDARLAAKQYFLGTNNVPSSQTENTASPAPKTVKPTKAVKATKGEGC